MNFTYTIIAGTFAPLGFWLIRKGKDDETSLILMIEMHILDSCAADFVTDKPVPALFALMVLPNTIFLLSTSVKFRVLNILLLFCQYVYHASAILKKFKVTFDDEQEIQILTGVMTSFCTIVVLCAQCLIKKSVETSLREVAQTNYEKSEVFAQASIDRKLPTFLWIDHSRILQIIMNLLSNSLKFTKRGGRIHIYVTWCSSSQTREQLLSPTENFIANENNRSQSSHVFPSQLNILSPERKDPDALAFEGFNKRETRDKIKNFQAFKHFKVNNPNISTISTSPERDHYDCDPEP